MWPWEWGREVWVGIAFFGPLLVFLASDGGRGTGGGSAGSQRER